MQMKLFLAADDIAMSLEVCPETWTAQKILRLHIHMFFKSTSSYLRFRPSTFLDLEGSAACMTSNVTAHSPGGRAKCSWSGFFYCCLLEKKGTVFTLATKAPFTKFLVSPSWILNLVQGDKLDTRVARQLLVKCVSASRHVKELEQYEMEPEKDAVKEAMEEAHILLSRQMKKQKMYGGDVGGLRDLTPSDEPTAAMYSFLFLVLGINVGNACSCLCQLRQSCGRGDVGPVADIRLGS